MISDMRMPGMDGVELLARVKASYPDVVRIMLTGNADQATAMEAVNQGEIFRFLTKPCQTELLILTLDQAIRQHELITAEKSLLDGTLKGSIRMLVDLLALLDPLSFGRAQHMTELAEAVARELKFENPWILGIAAVMSQIGILTVPEGVATKIRSGAFLNSHERDLANQVPQIGADLICNIPRLEDVAEAVRYMHKNINGTGFPEDDRQGETIPMAARILRVVWDFERLQARSGGAMGALAEMETRTTWYDLTVVRALRRCVAQWPDGASAAQPVQVAMHELQVGMQLMQGIETLDGLLVVPEGTRLGLAHLQKLRNFARLSGIREPIWVLGE